MRIGLIDVVTSKRAKSGASMALDLMSIPTRFIALGEGEVDRFEVESSGIKRQGARLKHDFVRFFGKQPAFVHI
jgi:hypothetical protein